MLFFITESFPPSFISLAALYYCRGVLWLQLLLAFSLHFRSKERATTVTVASVITIYCGLLSFCICFLYIYSHFSAFVEVTSFG